MQPVNVNIYLLRSAGTWLVCEMIFDDFDFERDC